MPPSPPNINADWFRSTGKAPSPQSLRELAPQLEQAGYRLGPNNARGFTDGIFTPDGRFIDVIKAATPDGGESWEFMDNGIPGRIAVPNPGNEGPHFGGYSPDGAINTQGGNIPKDLMPLRGFLQGYILDALKNPGGRFDPIFSRDELTLNMDPSWGRLNDTLYGVLGDSMRASHRGLGMLDSLMGTQAPQAAYSPELMHSLMRLGNPTTANDPLYNAAMNGTGMTALRNMATTGGRGDVQPALDAIKTSGMQTLEDTLAQIREQYGAMGLGAGSDISDALGRGASRGIADIVRQQSELATRLDSEAQQRMLAAGGAEQGALSNLWLGGRGNSIQALTQAGNFALGNAGLQGDHLNRLFGGANSYLHNGIAQNMAALTPGLSLYPQEATRNAEANLSRWYNEVLRQASGPPMLQQALGYATNFPPQQQPYQSSSGWPAALGAIGGGFMSALPFMPFMASDRNLKEDIKPVEGVLERLKELPLFTWKYKGDDTTHIGPMAQDFQKAFGVGDGKTLFFGDMLSVIMGSMKELANATA
jgi:hypothetical protein